MNKFLTVILAALSISGFAFAEDYINTEYYGEVHYQIADESGLVTFETLDELGLYLIIGLNDDPVILDISNEKDPAMLSGFHAIETDNDHGAYVAYNKQATIFACGVSDIIDVETISLR